MRRREFLKGQVAGALWLAASGRSLILSRKIMAAVSPDIAVVKGSPGPAARAAVELLGGMKSVVRSGNRVVIKPNMSFPSPPERASNTHPDVVREIAAMCKEASASQVLVLDHTLGPEELCLEASRIPEACAVIDKNMVKVFSNSEHFQETPLPNAVRLKKAAIMKEVLKADVIIAATVAKSHSGATVSLSLKGMMGLVHNRRVMHGLGLHTSIVDLCSVVKAHLTLIDATRVLSTNGPGGPGTVLNEKTVIASRDMVAADAYAVSSFEWYGQRLDPDQVPHIREAYERGLGRMDIEKFAVKAISV